MAIKDLFSDSNENNAKNKLKRAYGKGYKKSKRELKKGVKQLQNQYAKGLDLIGDSADVARTDLTQGRDAGLADFQPYADAAAPAAGLYSDALGLNGAAGNANAVDAFQTGPGYEFAMNQGLDAIDRRAASRGMLASGNNAIDTTDYAQGLARQEWGGWLDRLDGQQQFGAGVAGNMANIRTGVAGQMVDVGTQAGRGQAAIRTGIGDAKFGVQDQLGGMQYAKYLGRAGVKADYQIGKDASGAAAVGAATGTGSLGAKLLGI